MSKNPINQRTAYDQLLTAAEAMSDEMLLVLRKDLSISVRAKAVLAKLEPFLISKTQASEWPNTITVGIETLLRYKVTSDVIQILRRSAGTLYDWVQPKLPEDISFWRKGSFWFFSTTHEHYAGFELPEPELKELRTRFPALYAYAPKAAPQTTT